ncbi:hypothetical protein DMN91_009704 [Ooceraea biroi]|uniref:Testis-expressed sequence 2 protein n=1 Tax=Ooceraea biroi TaxID=2015173 RepID=A0A026WAH6_OOCBI|nr:testis-expressed protein 2 [Ooceraea biroi]EZA52034.1 Testis-expressed sequence 2 protein [Ooceraea biroi]RLU17469.1 hypothetical protein DMN91_009704 [Ooceraea biroi]
MSSKHSPGKIKLAIIKGKPIATSVPVIHYRANDDELEELYPSSSDEEKRLTPESDKQKVPSSPSKGSDNGQGMENESERRSVDSGNLSEGTPPSDPWKVLSEIKGKITKTFEEKLSEIKSDKKKRKIHKDSSISDPEDLGDVTPTDENVNDKQEREPGFSVVHCKSNAARFVGFSQVRTGLKTKNSQDDSVESGVEAAEFAESAPDSSFELQDDSRAEDAKTDAASPRDRFDQSDGSVREKKQVKFGTLLSYMKDHVFRQLTRQLVTLLALVIAVCSLIPLPAHLVGFSIGVFVTVTAYKLVQKIKEILTTPLDKEPTHTVVPVLEIPAAEEHVVQERYEGWLNQLPYTYDPQNYHVARTKSVFFSLEGGVLRVMETRMKVPKRAVWDEPKRKFKFTRRRVYNLAGAKIELLPEGLIRRRRWSKKYPICITMDRGALIDSGTLSDWTDILEKESLEDEKKIVQEGQEGEESTLADDTKSEDEDSRFELFKDNEDEELKIDEDDDDDDISQSKSIRSIYEDCRDDEEITKCKLYVFARADREKEDWYRRLTSAASLSRKRHSTSSVNDSTSCANATTSVQPDTAEAKLETSPEINYNTYMSKYLNVDPEGSPRECDVLWVNSFLGRLLFDMHSSPDTINLIQDKVQRKLSNIKLPYFMESLLVTEVVIGQDAPVVDKISKPVLDERGFWLDLNITYKGYVTMTVETKLNLMKLTRTTSVPGDIVDEKTVPTRSPIFDSDVEDSPETSTEDEDVGNVASCITSKDTTPVQSSGKKFLNMVDKLTANKYFRHATELSYIRRAMQGVSNTEIRFMVSVSGIEGCLSVNIPPPPSDRLWYGFKPVPKIAVTVQPAVGERTVNIVYVTKWIENKLRREFEKLVVLPNMDDLVLSLCPNYPFVAT